MNKQLQWQQIGSGASERCRWQQRLATRRRKLTRHAPTLCIQNSTVISSEGMVKLGRINTCGGMRQDWHE